MLALKLDFCGKKRLTTILHLFPPNCIIFFRQCSSWSLFFPPKSVRFIAYVGPKAIRFSVFSHFVSLMWQLSRIPCRGDLFGLDFKTARGFYIWEGRFSSSLRSVCSIRLLSTKGGLFLSWSWGMKVVAHFGPSFWWVCSGAIALQTTHLLRYKGGIF